MKVTAILAAAGAGRRLGAGKPKALVSVGGKTILRRAFEALDRAWPFEEFIVTAPPGKTRQIERALGRTPRTVRVVEGGATRALSVRRALDAVSDGSEWVLVHDAARPLVERETVRRTIRSAGRSGGAVAALPVSSTVKRARPDGSIERTVDRSGLYLAQTPQVFRKDLLDRRFAALGKKAAAATDDAALFDGTPVKVGIVEDSKRNFKVTSREDLNLLRFYLKKT